MERFWLVAWYQLKPANDIWGEQYRGNANKCWTKVMEHWLNGVGKDRYPPTWEGLYMLLEDTEYVQIAEELKKAVDETTMPTTSIDNFTTPVNGVKGASGNDKPGRSL